MKGIDIIYGLIYNVSRITSAAGVCVLKVPVFQILDKRYFGGVLKANEKHRLEQESRESPEDRRQGLRASKRSWTIAGLTLAAAMIITS